MNITEEILKILQKSQKPLGVSEIAREIGTERNVIHYHLKKLTDRGTVNSKDGKYSLRDNFAIIEKITGILAEKDCNIFELQNLGFDKQQIEDALYLLESKGWVYINRPVVAMTGAEHERETRYSLTPVAHSEKGLCPICKKSIDSSENVLIATIQTIKNRSWATASIHAKCYADSCDVYIPKDTFCDYCGLPISPKPLLGQEIGYKDIIDCFYKMEYYTILLLESLHLELKHYRYNEPKNYQEIKDNIQRAYEFHMERCKIKEIPDWILKGMELDEKPKRDIRSEIDAINKNFENSEAYKEFQSELKKADEIPIENRDSYYDSITEKRNNSEAYKKFDSEKKRLLKISQEETQYINPTYLDILKDLNVLVRGDLSYLQEAEEFLNCIKKYHNNLPNDYDIKSRIKDIWLSALKLKQEREKNILRMYEKLLQPSGIVYTYIQPLWAFNPQERKWIQDEGSEISSILGGYQSMAFKNGDKFYHPFCAEKLGLKNNGYCNNINSNGGEKSE